MATTHRVIKVQLSIDELAASQAKINQYLDTLNEAGKAGWQAYHVEEISDGLLVFLQQSD